MDRKLHIYFSSLLHCFNDTEIILHGHKYSITTLPNIRNKKLTLTSGNSTFHISFFNQDKSTISISFAFGLKTKILYIHYKVPETKNDVNEVIDNVRKIIWQNITKKQVTRTINNIYKAYYF